MLIAVTVMPIVFGLIETVPEGAAPMAGPVTAGVTIAVTLMIILRATGVMRLWGPVIGILSGCAVAGFFDLFSWEQLAAAQWIGLPVTGARRRRLVTTLSVDALPGAARRLRLSARSSQGGAELEFVAMSGEGNIEDRIALASEFSVELHAEHDFSLRLLRHLATTVRHQKYHDTDILTLQVDPPAA